MLYRFKSGKNEGKTLEWLAFTDYGRLLYLYNKATEKVLPTRKKNVYEQELTNIIALCEKPFVSSKICPICNKKTVKYLSIRYSSFQSTPSINASYCCCEDLDCKNYYIGIAGSPIEFFPLQISYCMRLSVKGDRLIFYDALKSLLDISRLDEKTLKRIFYPS